MCKHPIHGVMVRIRNFAKNHHPVIPLLHSWWTKPPNPNAHQVLQQWPDLLCGQTDLCPGSRMMLTEQGNTVFNELTNGDLLLFLGCWRVNRLTKWQTKWVLLKWLVTLEMTGIFQKELHDAFVDCSFENWCDFGWILVGFGFRRSPWVFSFEYSTCWEVLIILKLLSWWLF